MRIDATSIIYFFGAAQALLLLVGINYKQPLVSAAKQTTSLLLLVMLVVLFYYAVILNGVRAFYPYIHSFGGVGWMAIAPAYYLLLKSIREPKWRLGWRHVCYFSLSLVFLAELLLTLSGVPAWLFLLVQDGTLYLDIWMGYFFLTGGYFVGRTIWEEHRPEELAKNSTLRWFSYAFLLVLLVFAVIYLWVRRDYVVWFELSLIVFCELFVFALLFKTFKTMSFRRVFEQEKYDNGERSSAKLAQLAQQLEHTMETTQVYRQPTLSLNELAQQSGISANVLSQLFSLHYRSSFYDFVNQYRLTSVEQMMLDEGQQQYKIIALAEASGFKSKTTFYKVFKAKHQLTPAQYVRKYREG